MPTKSKIKRKRGAGAKAQPFDGGDVIDLVSSDDNGARSDDGDGNEKPQRSERAAARSPASSVASGAPRGARWSP